MEQHSPVIRLKNGVAGKTEAFFLCRKKITLEPSQKCVQPGLDILAISQGGGDLETVLNTNQCSRKRFKLQLENGKTKQTQQTSHHDFP